MYKLARKVNDKWLTMGTIKLNKWNKPALGMKKTPELVAWFNSVPEGEWLNLAVFEDKPKPAESYSQAPLDDAIEF